MDIDSLRKDINSIDEQVLRLLAQRRDVARQVIEYKRGHDLPLRDERREEDLLHQIIEKGRALGLDAHLVTRVFHEIIDDSVRAQQFVLQEGVNQDTRSPRVVAYQGIDGAYSHLAARKFMGSAAGSVSYAGYPTFAEVVEAVEEGIADFGLLPVENTTAGNINEVYDLLSRTQLHAVGEEIFRVNHCLLALEDTPLSSLRRILSHPQALAQCTRFLSQLVNCQQEFFTDTAMAVQKVRADGDPTQAAIASEEAGRIHGLRVIQRGLADQPENFTRFVVVARAPIRVDPRVPSKTSTILATSHEPGALNQALDVFYRNQINLTKLDARPKPGSPFEYLFYIDLEGSLEEKRVEAAIKGLQEKTTFLKILGSYPMESRSRTRPSTRSLARRTAGVESSDDPDGADVPEPSAPANGPGSGPDEAPAVTPIVEHFAEIADSADDERLVSRRSRPERTSVRVRDVKIGGPEFITIAGPCSVESEDQIRRCARHVRETGGHILRGGCFRPRISATSFRGLGFDGLELLARAGREYDLPIVTEVLSPDDVGPVADRADMLQVGARNMQNYPLLSRVGKVNRPVLLKRSPMASVEELLDAAECILAEGNHQVILCERGIRTIETATRNTLDLGAIPLLRERTHLPIIVDPSHAAGRRELVIPLALAARAVGPDGMMVEIHPRPEVALSDGPQALRFDDFSSLLERIYP